MPCPGPLTRGGAPRPPPLRPWGRALAPTGTGLRAGRPKSCVTEAQGHLGPTWGPLGDFLLFLLRLGWKGSPMVGSLGPTPFPFPFDTQQPALCPQHTSGGSGTLGAWGGGQGDWCSRGHWGGLWTASLCLRGPYSAWPGLSCTPPSLVGPMSPAPPALLSDRWASQEPSRLSPPDPNHTMVGTSTPRTSLSLLSGPLAASARPRSALRKTHNNGLVLGNSAPLSRSLGATWIRGQDLTL